MSRRIKFIGKTEHKRDNVCNTNLFWPHRGAIVEAPEEVAVRLLSYKDVWVEADPDDAGEEVAGQNDGFLTGDSGPMTDDQKIDAAINLIDDLDGWARVEAYMGKNIENDIQPEAEVPSDDEIPGAPETDVNENIFSNDRQEAIVEAIQLLESDNKGHFTDGGIPRVEAINAILGYSVTAEERTAALDIVQEGNEA